MSTFEHKTLPDGTPNPKYIDLCDEDPPIAGQKFTCVSFISPEKILAKRENFYFESFVRQWDFTKSMDKYSDFLQFIGMKYTLPIEDLKNDFVEFVKEEDAKLKSYTMTDDYANYLDRNEEKLMDTFNKQNAFQTSIRGIKIRGSYNTQEEAQLRAETLREVDKNHDIYIGQVGFWMPFHPDAYKTGRVEFLEEELNKLHHEKVKNEEKAKQEFEERIREAKRDAIRKNIEEAKKSGNVLTQTINEDGNLVGVRDQINFDDRDAAGTDIRNELSEQLKRATANLESSAENDTEEDSEPLSAISS